MKSEIQTYREMLDREVANSRTAWAEAQRINALWVQELVKVNELTLLLNRELVNSQTAWAEAQKLQAELVASRHGQAQVRQPTDALTGDLGKSRGEAGASKEQLQAGVLTGRNPITVESDLGLIMQGSWTDPDPVGAAMEECQRYFASTAPAEWGFDGAVLLMLPGWDQEMRGNRWHVINFLSRRMPVLVVQPFLLPTKTVTGPRLRRDWRFKGVWVLETHYHAVRSRDDVSEPILHLRDIVWAERRMGIAKPIYWCFSPYFSRLFCGLGRGYRMMHATEDWIQFPTLPEGARKDYAEAVVHADQVVAVSDGVAESIRNVAPAARIEVVTNGCQYAEYAAAAPHRTLVEMKAKHGRRLAVFAGNIDGRLDYNLLKRTADELNDITLCFVGPVAGQTQQEQNLWRALLKHECVFWLGRFDASLLPSLYHAADVGIVPYKHDDYIVRSNFSLKVLEMGAAGLPVVATLMKPIIGLADAIHVCDDSDAFISALRATSRATMSEAERIQLDDVARHNDYNTKLSAVLSRAIDKFRQEQRPEDPQVPIWARINSSSVVAAWHVLPEHAARIDLARAARQLRNALGRKHVTSRLALGRLGQHLAASKPDFSIRLLDASLNLRGIEDLSRHQRGLMVAAALCKLALARERLPLAVRAGEFGWGASRGAGLSASFVAEFGLAYADALMRSSRHKAANIVLSEIEQVAGWDAAEQNRTRLVTLREALTAGKKR